MVNNPLKVEKIFRDCLFRQEEIVDSKPTSEHIAVTGILIDKYMFHKGRIEEHTEEIQRMLEQTPESFQTGMSFLNFCDEVP